MPDPRSPAQPAIRARASATAASASGSASLHSGESWETATEAVLADLASDTAPDLLIVFVDSRFGAHYADVIERLQTRTGARNLVGCSGQGVIGSAVEAEDSPAVSALALCLPEATMTPLAITPGASDEHGINAQVAAGPSVWLLFADPYSVHTENLVAELQGQTSDIILLGGMASAHDQAAGTALFLDGQVHNRGAVLLGIGDVEVHSIVAQGAEPLGRPLTITECEENVVRTVGSRPALEVLRDTLAELDEGTRQRALQNLLVGIAMDEYQAEHGRGDYLIRNILGADHDTGAIAINALPRTGQTFQFQFRDARAADQDLRQHLADFKHRLGDDRAVVGAVLCACNGRGQGLFGEPSHDARALAEALGPVPTVGLFCNGEVGPVGGATFVHGFTASIALLTAARA